MQFDKLPKSHEEQLDLLISRGLSVPDRAFALHRLSKVNYYRLTAYRFPLAEPSNPDVFKAGGTFEDLWKIYDFDRNLRLLFLDAIEKIEVALRSVWAYKLAATHGAHSYTDSTLFKSSVDHTRLLSKLDGDIYRSKEPFVKHYQKKYKIPERPPIWAICELMTLGQLSRFCKALKHNSDKQNIGSEFKLKPESLFSYFESLTVIRNICAHHARLWNKKLTVTCQKPRRWHDDFKIAWNDNSSQERNIYNVIVLTLYILKELVPENMWGEHLLDLFSNHLLINPVEMGFPVNWASHNIWQRQS